MFTHDFLEVRGKKDLPVHQPRNKLMVFLSSLRINLCVAVDRCVDFVAGSVEAGITQIITHFLEKCSFAGLND
jgi:hypothetical protein